MLLKKGEPSGDRKRNITEKFPLLAIRLMDHHLDGPVLRDAIAVNAVASADNKYVIT